MDSNLAMIALLRKSGSKVRLTGRELRECEGYRIRVTEEDGETVLVAYKPEDKRDRR